MLLLHLSQQNQLRNFKFYVKLKRVFCIFLSILLLNGFHAQYFYLPSTTQGNPGGLNNDNEYPNGSGLDASWTSLLPGGNSSPTWSPIDTVHLIYLNGSPVSTFKVSSSECLHLQPVLVLRLFMPMQVFQIQEYQITPSWYGELKELVLMMKLLPKHLETLVDNNIAFSSYTTGSWSYGSIVFEEGQTKIL